jgi:hypothetical protein
VDAGTYGAGTYVAGTYGDGSAASDFECIQVDNLYPTFPTPLTHTKPSGTSSKAAVGAIVGALLTTVFVLSIGAMVSAECSGVPLNRYSIMRW